MIPVLASESQSNDLLFFNLQKKKIYFIQRNEI